MAPFVGGASMAVAAVSGFSFASRNEQPFGEVQRPGTLSASAAVAFVAIVAWAVVLGFSLS